MISAGPSLDAKSIVAAAAAGDPHASEAWRRYVSDLSIGIANVVTFLNPHIIAISGGLSAAGDMLVSAVKPLVDARLTMVPIGTTAIRLAVLGNDAGAIGAAAFARERSQRAGPVISALTDGRALEL
ncbi:MAG: ROK family protein [Candidatus Eremiobacteraeota bacterium]|nr:ROK family protein [Candidatus Eremiobacteraeota bacterium]MBC5804589.1 ROK family protein [Candidatus Eremiobacteraeota bacterium]MBC5822067.1 ROK family protein [Candidatus Eremiobacteraeota bacterium]